MKLVSFPVLKFKSDFNAQRDIGVQATRFDNLAFETFDDFWLA